MMNPIAGEAGSELKINRVTDEERISFMRSINRKRKTLDPKTISIRYNNSDKEENDAQPIVEPAEHSS